MNDIERVWDPLLETFYFVQSAKQVELELASQSRKRRNDDVFANRLSREPLTDLVASGEAKLAHIRHVHAADVASIEHYASGGRCYLAGQHLEERRLACAIGADDAVQFASLDRKIDIIVGDNAAVSLG